MSETNEVTALASQLSLSLELNSNSVLSIIIPTPNQLYKGLPLTWAPRRPRSSRSRRRNLYVPRRLFPTSARDLTREHHRSCPGAPHKVRQTRACRNLDMGCNLRRLELQLCAINQEVEASNRQQTEASIEQAAPTLTVPPSMENEAR